MGKGKVPYYSYSFSLKPTGNRNCRTQGEADINRRKWFRSAPYLTAHIPCNPDTGYAEKIVKGEIGAVLTD